MRSWLESVDDVDGGEVAASFLATAPTIAMTLLVFSGIVGSFRILAETLEADRDTVTARFPLPFETSDILEGDLGK